MTNEVLIKEKDGDFSLVVINEMLRELYMTTKLKYYCKWVCSSEWHQSWKLL